MTDIKTLENTKAHFCPLKFGFVFILILYISKLTIWPSVFDFVFILALSCISVSNLTVKS